MVNITLAEVTPSSPVAAGSPVAGVNAAQAAMRPLAGFGAGAFTHDGAGVGSFANQLAAGATLPRIPDGFAAIRPVHFGASTVDASDGYAGIVSTKQLNQMTRRYPVAPGGLGPHPAREPDPV